MYILKKLPKFNLVKDNTFKYIYTVFHYHLFLYDEFPAHGMFFCFQGPGGKSD